LENAVRHGGGNLVELLLSTVSGQHPQSPGRRVSQTLAAAYSRKLLVIGDGLKSHRSRLVWDFVREQHGCIWLEFLPAYAPELNPVEYLWGYLKQHELPNFCPKNFGELSHNGRQALRRMRRRPTLVMAFWEQAELSPL
jgi:transposase